jgi:hypothetical protein
LARYGPNEEIVGGQPDDNDDNGQQITGRDPDRHDGKARQKPGKGEQLDASKNLAVSGLM